MAGAMVICQLLVAFSVLGQGNNTSTSLATAIKNLPRITETRHKVLIHLHR